MQRHGADAFVVTEYYHYTPTSVTFTWPRKNNETEHALLCNICTRGRNDDTGALATRILAAWGDQDTISYHDADFAKGQVILYGGMENSIFDPIVELTSDPGVLSFDVAAVRAMLGKSELSELVH